MSVITYIITIYNKERYIDSVVQSLKNIQNQFRKEFIFIDDGSTDQSLAILQGAASSLPRSIIVSQQNSGPAITVNKAIKLAHGNYVHFIDGDDVIAHDSTSLLLQACKDFNVDVAYGLRGKCDNQTMNLIPSKREREYKENILIESPIKAILEALWPGVRTIGSSGSLVKKSLLDKIGGADIKVFSQDLSISLRCAIFSKFVFVPKTVSYSPITYDKNNLSYDKQFESYNTLKAILHFIEENEEVCESFKPELYKVLYSTIWKLDKFSLSVLPKYLLSKYIRNKLSLDDLESLYKEYIKKLV